MWQFGTSMPFPGHAEVRRALYKSGLVGVTAVAHALDALYGELMDRVPHDVRVAWARNRTPRQYRILETMKFAGGTQRAAWSSEFTWLFDERRDPALHPDSETRPLEPHPAGGHSSRERVRYTVETIARALDLLVSVLDALGESTKLGESAVKRYERLSAQIAAERLADARVAAVVDE